MEPQVETFLIKPLIKKERMIKTMQIDEPITEQIAEPITFKQQRRLITRQKETSRAGRPKGSVTTREAYVLYVYDIKTEEYDDMGKYATFGDITKFLNSKGIHITYCIVQNIYMNKTINNFIKIVHLK